MKSKLGIPLVISFVILTLSLLALAKFYGEGFQFSWLLVSQIFSLTGITLLCLNFVLASRWYFITDLFGGLDRVYQQHHILGGLAFVFLLHHPIFLVFDLFPHTDLAWKYLWFSDLQAYNWGILSLYFMTLILILTILINLPYALWKKIHEFMGVVLIFIYLHVSTIPSDVNRFLPLRYWIFFLLAIAAYAATYRRFLYDFFGPKWHYVIQKIQKTQNYLSLDLAPVSSPMPFEPGQFVFTQFGDLSKELHPFSLASDPSEKNLRLVIKELGYYTEQLSTLTPGGSVTLWGPYGQFGTNVFGKSELIWIAGGIGITPFLSLLPAQLKTSRPKKIDLFYSVSHLEEAIFDEEIKRIANRIPGFTYHLHVSETDGRLNVAQIAKICGPLKKQKIMLCGPLSMMTSLAEQFKKAGIKNHRIIFEDFNFK